MPTMKETEFTATITWLGVVPKLAKGIRAEPRSEAFASYAGFEDDVHAGLTRASCVRVTNPVSYTHLTLPTICSV